MNKLIEGITEYLRLFHNGVDIYSVDDDIIIAAGYWINDNPRYLPRTNRGKSKVTNKWKSGIWKKVYKFRDCKEEELYTLLIPMKSKKLYSLETAKEIKYIRENILKTFPIFYYSVESSKKKGVHMHVIVNTEIPPTERFYIGKKYYNLKPRPFYYEDNLTMGLIRFTTYINKIKQGEYRKGAKSYKLAWLNEVIEYINLERETVYNLTGSNIKLGGSIKCPTELNEIYEAIKTDREEGLKNRRAKNSSIVYTHNQQTTSPTALNPLPYLSN